MQALPFDHPSLVLGHLVDPRLLALLEQIRSHQGRCDAALTRMNSLLELRRSLGMTLTEMEGLQVPMDALRQRLDDSGKAVGEAAAAYVQARLDSEQQVQALREQIAALPDIGFAQTPLDLGGCAVDYHPLSADSLRMDLQYFSYGSNESSGMEAITALQDTIRDNVKDLGKAGTEAVKTAGEQVSRQRARHNLAGTLVIVASATHRKVAMLKNRAFDAQRLLDLWNRAHGEAGHRIAPDDLDALSQRAQQTPAAGDPTLDLITGVTLGSSFIGMVHIINSESAQLGLDPDEEKALQEQLRLGSWLNAAAGGMGVDDRVLDQVRDLISRRTVSTHANLIALGVLPELTSAQAQKSVSQALGAHNRSYLPSDPGGKSTMGSVAQDGTRLRAQAGMHGQMLKDAIEGLGKIDQAANKTVDLHTLMVAFDSYLQQIREEKTTGGMPTGFLLHRIGAAEVARLWIDGRAAPKPATPTTPSPAR